MPYFQRSAKAGDPTGEVVIHAPEEIIRAKRGPEGVLIAHVTKGSSVRALLRKGFRCVGENAPDAPEAPKVKVKVSKSPKAAKPSQSKAKATKPSMSKAEALVALDSSIGDLEDALATGKYDSHLSDMLSAERGGKTRKGAVTAIKARQANK